MWSESKVELTGIVRNPKHWEWGVEVVDKTSQKTVVIPCYEDPVQMWEPIEIFAAYSLDGALLVNVEQFEVALTVVYEGKSRSIGWENHSIGAPSVDTELGD
jgi:hypothetical protein